MSSQIVHFELANCDAKVAFFLGGITAIFCDPKNVGIVEELKRGTIGLQMDPRNGQAAVICLDGVQAPDETFIQVTAPTLTPIQRN
jgi:hypothetical protein